MTQICSGCVHVSPSPTRLDLVPINRSVGLKAKPTKPVTEVLRPVVAKYGLHLSELVARLVSDLGACGVILSSVPICRAVPLPPHPWSRGSTRH